MPRGKLIFTFQLISTLLVITTAFITVAIAQRPASNPSREIVRNLQIKDMDRMLEYKLLPPNAVDNSARMIVMKQVGEDFHALQALNNEMMTATWSKPALDYGFLANMISRIRGRAARLKGNLNLPVPSHSEKTDTRIAIANDQDFRRQLLLLDRTIMSFVSNPLFQKANTIDLQLGLNARRDLETVLMLTADLKKTATRFGKGMPSQ